MTEASRRRLFERTETDRRLTAQDIRILRWIGECGLLTVPQVAGLTGSSDQAVRKHLRKVFDMGLADRIGIDRSVLTPIDHPNTPDLLGGRAPTIYRLTRDGGDVIGMKLPAQLPSYGPRNSPKLAHEIEIRDVRVWLERQGREYGHEGCTMWRTDRAGWLGTAHPDALFTYRFPKATLVGLVETDRGTERGTEWWDRKLDYYAAMYRTDAILEATGQKSGRMLVVAPNARRRDAIAAMLAARLHTTRIVDSQLNELRNRFWITEKSTLEKVDQTGKLDIAAEVWRVPEHDGLMPLVTPDLL
jgi:hypothetical protein